MSIKKSPQRGLLTHKNNLLRTLLCAFAAANAFFGIYHSVEILYLYCVMLTRSHAFHAADTAYLAGFSCNRSLVAAAAFYDCS